MIARPIRHDSAAAPRRHRWRARVLWIGVALVVGVMALLLLPGKRDSGPRDGVFPDGSRIEFLGAAVGSSTFTTERPWHRVLRGVLPGRWQGALPSPVTGSCSSGTNSVTLYFLLTSPGTVPWQHYAAEDDTGFRHQAGGGHCSIGGGGPGVGQVHGIFLRALPRRQASFRLVFLDADFQPALTLRLPNPAPGPFPEWHPEPLPVTRTNDPVAMTLKGLRLTPPGRWRSLRTEVETATEDVRWKAARLGPAEARDATGNAGQFLSPAEKAWRVTLPLHRSRWEDFGPEEVLVLTNLALPAPGQFLALDRTVEHSGVRLSAGTLCGAGQLFITNGVRRAMLPTVAGSGGHGTMTDSSTTVEFWGQAKPFLFIEVAGIGGEDELRVRLFDVAGQELRLEDRGGYSYRSSTASRVYTRELPITNGVLGRVEMVVSRPLLFEFDISPAQVQGLLPGTAVR